MSKVIVVTGAGGGLGRALARRFVRDGETVVLLGRTSASIAAVAAEGGDHAVAIRCDVSSPDEVREAFSMIAERFTAIDVLINNAAVYDLFAVEDATDAQIAAALDTNLAGPIFCCRAAIPLMGEDGHIINVSSEGVELPFPLMSVYQASKAGLERFTTALYRELEPRGIRVSCVRAGAMTEEGKVWNVDPETTARFRALAHASGLELSGRPVSQFESITTIFRTLIDLPADVHALTIGLFGRQT